MRKIKNQKYRKECQISALKISFLNFSHSNPVHINFDILFCYENDMTKQLIKRLSTKSPKISLLEQHLLIGLRTADKYRTIPNNVAWYTIRILHF